MVGPGTKAHQYRPGVPLPVTRAATTDDTVSDTIGTDRRTADFPDATLLLVCRLRSGMSERESKSEDGGEIGGDGGARSDR